ncbi:hypothetical protein SBA6_1110001 [Candidatus Sulfopaludibacter sp. SbA6]|nr:hypothetical protein SBA6_1110001 [Candidatus Sulfopaludibacter sp. SbA6]
MASELETALFVATSGGSCPTRVNEVIRGWGQYKEKVTLLPGTEQAKIDQIAVLVVRSFTTPGCVPLGRITIVGHADKDFHGAVLEQSVSDGRAEEIEAALAAAIERVFKAHGIMRFPGTPIDFKVSGAGATQPDPINVPRVKDRTLNRRVTIQVSPQGAPVPPPPPSPAMEFRNRTRRAIDLLNKPGIGMPNGQEQTTRVKCLLDKLRNNPSVKDSFVDGDLNIVRIRGRQVNGIQEVLRNYGNLTQEEREVLFAHAGPRVLSDPRFAITASESDTISALNDLDHSIKGGIDLLNAAVERGNASDASKQLLRDQISRLQQDPDSIYSCYAQF